MEDLHPLTQKCRHLILTYHPLTWKLKYKIRCMLIDQFKLIITNLQLISGQRLCWWKRKYSSTVATIETYGITHDCTSIKTPNVSSIAYIYIYIWLTYNAAGYTALRIILSSVARQCTLALLGERGVCIEEYHLHA